jgi:ribosomal protein S18 acetylase RimI-like enzyme
VPGTRFQALPRQRWTPRAVAGRTVEVLRTEGTRSLLFRVLGELAYRRMIVMERQFDLSMRDVDPDVAVRFAPLDPADVDEYLRLRPDADGAEVRERLRRRHVCWVAWLDGRIVQACWVAVDRAYVDYLRCWLHLGSGVGYLHDLYTAPELRGRNLHRAMYPHIFRYFRNAGARAVVAAFQPENRIQRIFARLGFRPVAIAGVVGRGPLRRAFERRLEPAGDRPTFRVSLKPEP